MDQNHDHATRQRLLEAWLPLAQALNSEFGWGLGAPALEQLVLGAAAALAHVGCLADARAVLYYHHWRLFGGVR